MKLKDTRIMISGKVGDNTEICETTIGQLCADMFDQLEEDELEFVVGGLNMKLDMGAKEMSGVFYDDNDDYDRGDDNPHRWRCTC